MLLSYFVVVVISELSIANSILSVFSSFHLPPPLLLPPPPPPPPPPPFLLVPYLPLRSVSPKSTSHISAFNSIMSARFSPVHSVWKRAQTRQCGDVEMRSGSKTSAVGASDRDVTCARLKNPKKKKRLIKKHGVCRSPSAASSAQFCSASRAHLRVYLAIPTDALSSDDIPARNSSKFTRAIDWASRFLQVLPSREYTECTIGYNFKRGDVCSFCVREFWLIFFYFLFYFILFLSFSKFEKQWVARRREGAKRRLIASSRAVCVRRATVHKSLAGAHFRTLIFCTALQARVLRVCCTWNSSTQTHWTAARRRQSARTPKRALRAPHASSPNV